MADTSMFRKAALEKLSSPEQLDVLMKVTSPRGWLALSALFAIIVVVILWSYFGAIPEKVMGQGILIKGASIREIASTTAGQIKKINTKVGDIIRQGQVIAEIGQGGLDRQINTLSKHIEIIKKQHIEQAILQEKNLSLSLQALKEETKSRQVSTANLQKQIRSLQEKVNVQKTLFKKGLVTKSTLLNTQKELSATRSSIDNNNVRLAQINSEIVALKRSFNKTEVGRENSLNQLQRELGELKSKLDGSSKIISAYDGQVLELMVDQGTLIQPQSRILTLEALDNTLEAVLYIPATDGKRVKTGMEVRISPSTVKAEEFGFIIAEVRSVSEFPTTLGGMRRVLRNEALVKELSGNSSRIEIIAKLELNPNTPSGFEWSSSQGPDSGVFSGTLCNGTVIINKRRPLGLVIPLFKKSLGI